MPFGQYFTLCIEKIEKYIESNFEKENISCKLFLGIDAT